MRPPLKVEYEYNNRDESNIDSDLTISVYGSSCHHSLYCLILADFQGRLGCQDIDRERKGARIRQVKNKLHELPHTEIVKSGTIKLASGEHF